MFLFNIQAWKNYKKCGRTIQNIQKRLSNLQTSLLDNCNIIYITEKLIDTYFYEYLLIKILKNFRIRSNREFFDINLDEIIEIYETFNHMNKILNTNDKLNEYINNFHPEYFNNKKCNHSSNEKYKIKKKGIWIDTSYL